MDNRRIPTFKQMFLKKMVFTPTPDQQNLIEWLDWFVFGSPDTAFVLKGYAGTGKTTVISALIKSLRMFGIKTVLLAPTGRAAKVLSQYSEKQAYTIHKHIYFTHRTDDSFSFHLKENKYADTVFIVDESSMIGTGSHSGFMQRSILDDLMAYVRQGLRCKVIFAGDTAQLPPVENTLSATYSGQYVSEENISGALNPDYLFYNYQTKAEQYQLTQVVRQALDSNILKNASNLRYRISMNNYGLPLLKINSEWEDFKVIGDADFEQELSNAYKEFGRDEVICICRSNKSANILNNRIRYAILDQENQLDTGDNLMAVKNNYYWLENYEIGGFIANGDIFKVKRILGYEDKFGCHFADIEAVFMDYEQQTEVALTILLDTLSTDKASLDTNGDDSLYYKVFNSYYTECGNKAEAKKLTLQDKYFNAVQVKFASVLTCHKAQGGGWKAVFVVQNFFTHDMLNKDYLRWLYTAVTRAKQRIYLVGFSEDFFKYE